MATAQYKCVGRHAKFVHHYLEVKAVIGQGASHPTGVVEVPALDRPGHFFPTRVFQQEGQEV